jgi:hypothetical protein
VPPERKKKMSTTVKKKKTTAENLEEKFDNGEDISDYFQFGNSRPLQDKPRRVTADLPGWIVAALDKEAGQLGIARIAVLKTWLAERIRENRVAER